MKGYANLWKLGDLCATSVFGKFIVVCTNKEMVKQIFTESTGVVQLCLVDSMKQIISPENFVFSFGNIHKIQKGSFISFLTKKSIEKYAVSQLDNMTKEISQWKMSFNKNHYNYNFRWLNLHAFFSVFFGSFLDKQHYNQIAEDLETLTQALQLVNFPIALPGTKVYNAIHARKRIVNSFKEAIKLCQQKVNINYESIIDEKDKKVMLYQIMTAKSDSDMINNHEQLALALFSFIFASQDAMSSSVSWIISRLVNHQDIQESLYNEIKDVTDIQTLCDNKVLESFIKESLRTRPSVIMVPHKLSQSYKIGDHTLQPNTIIIPSIWATAHDSSNYEHPNEFKPTRFIDSKENFSNSFTFGCGLHSCMGYNFTIQHLLLMVVAILKQYTVTSEKPIDMNDVRIFSTSYPNKDVKFKFIIRE
ncbi:MAG: hypothetical protein Edafosvirus2_25 [Edafosvirus sp.]|uniref:Cytochrome P450 n=1 Tax=Edafosvirus sp. TaxID=2487765 RepID=A0A3G4ZSH4_9VIRU|nr:MAG: hypothetical protein Edafosvirus2_25 [Edafosvirus sp.]